MMEVFTEWAASNLDLEGWPGFSVDGRTWAERVQTNMSVSQHRKGQIMGMAFVFMLKPVVVLLLQHFYGRTKGDLGYEYAEMPG